MPQLGEALRSLFWCYSQFELVSGVYVNVSVDVGFGRIHRVLERP